MASLVERAEYLEDQAKEKEGPKDVRQVLIETPGVAGWLQSKFYTAETARDYQEGIMEKSWVNFRSEPGTTAKLRDSEVSEVNVKITKVKVLTAYGHITEALFGQDRFPMAIESTEIPRGIADKAHIDPTGGQVAGKLADPFGYKGDGREIAPGATSGIPLGGLQEELGGVSLVPGEGKVGEPTIHPAKIAADRMDRVVKDQLQDNKADVEVSKAIWECALLGTGVLKGPFNHRKTIHKWTKLDETDQDEDDERPKGKRKYEPTTVVVPRIKYRSVWNVYPDPDATNQEEIEYVFERHRMGESELADLATQPGFDEDAIAEAIDKGPSYTKKDWEDTIYRNDTHVNFQNRYEVLEYWGLLPRSKAIELGLPVKEGGVGSVNVNIWICGGIILRAVLNPFTPQRIPYMFVPYEVNPYSIWGIGVAENMEDAQRLMNGHMRMGIDNQALAGNVILEVDEANLVAGQDFKLYPGKIFYKKAGASGSAIKDVKIQNTGTTNIEFYRMARQLADEETGLPSVMHGQTGVSGTGRTSSGLSMIMGSASINIKTVIRNIDTFLIKPLGEGFFQWNMQFNDEDMGIVGDLEIKPKATAALLSKEVKTQRLESLLSVAVNPMLAPFFKLNRIIEELVRLLDMNPEDYVNNPEEAAIYAEILRGLLDAQGATEQPATGGQQQPVLGSPQGVPGGTPGGDPRGTGNGGITPATPSSPGESGFTGTPQ